VSKSRKSGVKVKEWVYTPTCKHNTQPVAVGSRFIYASAYSNLNYPRESIDFGIYFADGWNHLFQPPKIYGDIPGFAPPPVKAKFPAMVIDWEDGSSLDYKTIKWLIDGTIANLAEGKKIDVGCFGGHGRTGMFLACLIGTVESLDARESILTMRERYCQEAIETYSQIWGVANFLGTAVPEDIPLPFKSWGTY
jgi:hypothetical protein